MAATVYFGQFVTPRSFDQLHTESDGFVAVDASGTIVAMGEKSAFDAWKSPQKASFAIRQLTEEQFLMPGFIDCHLHAPQFPNLGIGLDRPLLEWLNNYTFPIESRFKDAGLARKVFSSVVHRTLQMGTTTACYFGTIYKEANEILAEEMISQGQRGFVGKVAMNQMSPEYYVESCEASLKDTEEFVLKIRSMGSELVRPVITPRFAISCTAELMTGLAQLAAKYDLLVQSHISENVDEVKFVRELFPEAADYADVYKRCGLLTSKTVLAHGVHIEDAELEVFKQTGTSIAHCPNSNTYLSSGVCDVKRIRAHGVKVGLGCDVSGGNRIGIFDVMRHALEVSQMIGFVKSQDIKGSGQLPPADRDATYVPLNYKNALFLATLGGAEALSLDDTVGSFTVGKKFDALLIDMSLLPAPNAGDVLEPAERLSQLIRKFFYAGDDRVIREVFVNGRQVKQAN